MQFTKEMGLILFDGYYEGGGMGRDGEPSPKVRQGTRKPKAYEIAKREYQWLLGKIKPGIVLTDYDSDEIFQSRLKIVQSLNQHCIVIKGAHKGGHIYWANRTQAVTTSNNKLKTVLTFYPVDYKCGVKLVKSTGEIKPADTYGALQNDDGSFREVLYFNPADDGSLDELPFYDRPLQSGEKHNFLGMKEGDGRQDGLFTYMIPMKGAGFTYEQYEETADLINKFIFAEPLNREFNNAKRREAWDSVDINAASGFLKGGKFLHDQFAEYIMRNHNVCLVQDQLCIYQDGVYDATEDALERAIIKELPQLKDSQIKEVTKRLRRICPVKQQSRPTLIAFSNGLYDLETDEFREFTPTEIILNRIPWPYNPAAYSELLDQTLDKITCNDPGIRALLEEVSGYCMYRRNSLEKALILIGEKGNGKSTFLYIIQHMLGDKNIASLDLKELGDRFKTAELFGKLANIGDDIGDEFIANASIFRKLVTGERVSVERKGADPFEFNNYSTFLFSANEIPRIKDKTGAVQRRLAIVPFDAKFTPDDPDYDPNLKYKLSQQEHLEYMIVLSIAGIKRALAQKHFTEPQKVKDANREYEERNNPLLGFVEEIGPDDILHEDTKEIYRKYKEYCFANKFQELSSIEFSRQICKRLKLKIVKRKRSVGRGKREDYKTYELSAD